MASHPPGGAEPRLRLVPLDWSRLSPRGTPVRGEMARTITLMEAVHVLQLGHLPEPCQSLPFLDRLKQLDDERVTIIEAAKAAAFAQADEAVSLLNAIGYTCEIALAPEPAATPRKTPRQVYTNGPCPICEFRTDPPTTPAATAVRARRSSRSATMS